MVGFGLFLFSGKKQRRKETRSEEAKGEEFNNSGVEEEVRRENWVSVL